MRVKITATMLLAVLLCAAAPAQGTSLDAQHWVDVDSAGALCHAWLATAEGTAESGSADIELKYFASSRTAPVTLFSFTHEVTSYDLAIAPSRFYLAFSPTETGGERGGILWTFSRDNGNSFSVPVILAAEGEAPSLAIRNGTVLAAWVSNEAISCSVSLDGGMNFQPRGNIAASGETLSAPRALIDGDGARHLVHLSKDNDTGINRVVYSRLPTCEPEVIFESPDTLANLGFQQLGRLLMVSWQKEYFERRETYFCVSLDGGLNFGAARLVEFDKELLGFALLKEKLFALTGDTASLAEPAAAGLRLTEIELKPIPAPVLSFPREAETLNFSSLRLAYTPATTDPFICQAQLSADMATWDFEQTVARVSQECVGFSFPAQVADGSYEVRVRITDGLTTSPYSQPVKLRVDNTCPTLVTLEAEKNEKILTMKGRVSEYPAWLTVNERLQTIEALAFESSFALDPGNNSFTLRLTDEAGNFSVSTKEVFYDPAVPEIVVTNPTQDDWFRPAAAMIIEAAVHDLQGDIEQGAEAQISINGRLLDGTLAFDPEEAALYGFITLPPDLIDGTHSGRIALCDISGNQGEAGFKVNIDSRAPAVSVGPGGSYYTNSREAIVLPVADVGAGIDPSGTLVTVSGISLEGAVSLEAGSLVLACALPAAEGTYEVEITARDQVGNLGETTIFCLVVDATTPELTLLGSYEPAVSAPLLTVQAMVKDASPCQVRLYNNGKKIEGFSLSGDRFSKEINLFQGKNEVRVEVEDQAGNLSEATINTLASFSVSASGLIASCAHGPNPFSPARDLPAAFAADGKGMVFSYDLLQPADVRIMIFDITGTLIWTRNISNATSGTTAWDGTNAFREVVQNGIYPYVFSASTGGGTEIRRGKIIVLQ